jgi:hypothetical protein
VPKWADLKVAKTATAKAHVMADSLAKLRVAGWVVSWAQSWVVWTAAKREDTRVHTRVGS